MKLDLPVMAVALVLAAALQETLPPPPIGSPALKVQLLPAIALYYARRRPWPLALTAALWAGILTDALGGLPPGTTSFALLAFCGGVLLLRDTARELSPLDAIPQAFCLFLVLAFVQAARLDLSGLARDVPLWRGFLSGVKLLPLSVAAAVAADFALARVEAAAGNVEPKKGGGLE